MRRIVLACIVVGLTAAYGVSRLLTPTPQPITAQIDHLTISPAGRADLRLTVTNLGPVTLDLDAASIILVARTGDDGPERRWSAAPGSASALALPGVPLPVSLGADLPPGAEVRAIVLALPGQRPVVIPAYQ
jgi:hypothetical protein